jgi:hypothetical protein
MMDYRVFSMSSGEDENSTEAHVFARAYRGAWRSIYGAEPGGRHQVAALELVMDFGARAPVRVGTSHEGVALTAGGVEPACAAVDVPAGGQHDN